MKINARFLAVAVGVFTGVMVLYFTFELWTNPVEFTGKFAPPLATVDYGTLIRSRWVANRIAPYGIVMLICALKKQYRLIGILLVMRFGVDLLDGFVLTLGLMHGVHGTATNTTMYGAYFLCILNIIAGIYLLRQPDQVSAAASSR
ncbi:MAG TPA: hypothetical protein VG759_23580 [Candidatus Angelobacter sp.]|jgi:hypothetical protein|nr:hypothetical protein [Candidatus Angelobacter sp.]